MTLTDPQNVVGTLGMLKPNQTPVNMLVEEAAARVTK
jgi:hypothetical protein